MMGLRGGKMAERTSIYPTFNLPVISNVGNVTPKKKYAPSFKFDYDTGDFVRDGAGRLILADGKETFASWCLKQCVTERYTKMAYGKSIGVEIENKIKNETEIEAVESIIQRTITEALLQNPATEYVRDFEFSWDYAGALSVTFVVKGTKWNENMKLKVGYTI